MNKRCPECDVFPAASLSFAICNGTSGRSLEETNRFRARHRLAPLTDSQGAAETVPITKSSKGVSVRRLPNIQSQQSSKGCCSGGGSGSQQRSGLNGWGPGSQLLKTFKAAGLVACDACLDLAARMDGWGIEGCAERVDEIVADILPRALAWEAEKVGWLSRLIPEAVTGRAIQSLVNLAIEKARPSRQVHGSATARRVTTVIHSDGIYQSRPTGPPIVPVDLAGAVRHLTFHVWPVRGFGVWQWNCDRLLASASLFNGRRIVAIAESAETDSPDEVRKYLGDFTDEFLVVPNNSKLREVVTWLPMLERLERYQSEADVTFSGHAKGVRHMVTAGTERSTLFRWTEAMYDTCLNWDAVRPLLEVKGTVGSFRRIQGSNPRRGGFGPWHFSGTFYWWRNRDVFRRHWRYVPQRFFGTEAWPGLVFTEEESGVIACDRVGDLYKYDYWMREIEPQLAQWRSNRGDHHEDRT